MGATSSVVRGVHLGRDVKDRRFSVLCHAPRDERATLRLGSGQVLQLLPDTRPPLVADFEPMPVAASARIRHIGQVLPAAQALPPIVGPECAGQRQLAAVRSARNIVHVGKCAAAEPRLVKDDASRWPIG